MAKSPLSPLISAGGTVILVGGLVIVGLLVLSKFDIFNIAKKAFGDIGSKASSSVKDLDAQTKSVEEQRKQVELSKESLGAESEAVKAGEQLLKQKERDLELQRESVSLQEKQSKIQSKQGEFKKLVRNKDQITKDARVRFEKRKADRQKGIVTILPFKGSTKAYIEQLEFQKKIAKGEIKMPKKVAEARAKRKADKAKSFQNKPKRTGRTATNRKRR